MKWPSEYDGMIIYLKTENCELREKDSGAEECCLQLIKGHRPVLLYLHGSLFSKLDTAEIVIVGECLYAIQNTHSIIQFYTQGSHMDMSKSNHTSLCKYLGESQGGIPPE